MPSDPERRARGAQKIGEILGQTPEQVERSLDDVAPQLATYVLETIYGEIYQSRALDARTRQIVTVAALATLGTAVLGYIAYNLTFEQPQGRYLFSALVPIAILLIVGWAGWMPRRVQPWGIVAIGSGLVALNAYALTRVLVLGFAPAG